MLPSVGSRLSSMMRQHTARLWRTVAMMFQAWAAFSFSSTWRELPNPCCPLWVCLSHCESLFPIVILCCPVLVAHCEFSLVIASLCCLLLVCVASVNLFLPVNYESWLFLLLLLNQELDCSCPVDPSTGDSILSWQVQIFLPMVMVMAISMRMMRNFLSAMMMMIMTKVVTQQAAQKTRLSVPPMTILTARSLLAPSRALYVTMSHWNAHGWIQRKIETKILTQKGQAF